jgi:hypothetical protein
VIRHLFPRHMPLKTWIVFYIKGSKSQQHLGLIYALTRIEAELETYRIFKATTPSEQRRVYVIEKTCKATIRSHC